MRQAVLLIHGIGEQRPMSTLRSFVEAVLPDKVDGSEKYRSKPDPLSSTLELRRLAAHQRFATDFYEYYWAHHTEGTTLTAVLAWLVSLVVRRKRDVPNHLRPLWRLSRVLLLVVLILLASGISSWLQSFSGTSLWFIGAGLTAGLQW